MGYEQFRGRMIAPQSCAEALDNSEFTIHRWIREGKIKAIKLSSRCTRIDGDSLADFLDSRVFNPGKRLEQPEPLKAAAAKRRKVAKVSRIDLASQA